MIILAFALFVAQATAASPKPAGPPTAEATRTVSQPVATTAAEQPAAARSSAPTTPAAEPPDVAGILGTQPRQPDGTGHANANETPQPGADYQVGFGDVLQITVFGDDDISRIAEVQPNGAVTIRYLGEVPVAGLTLPQVQELLRQRLGENLLVNPQIEVKVREYRSQFVFVGGEVNSPGRKALRGNTQLVDVLLEAGGFSPRASYELTISRTQGEFRDGTKQLRFRLAPTPTPEDQWKLQLPLRNGDIITASPKYYVTIDGEVNHPGRYVLEPDLTVTGVLSQAGGLTRFGSSTLKVRRIDPQSSQVSILEVDVKDVRNGKTPDLPLLPNDVVSVGKRRF